MTEGNSAGRIYWVGGSKGGVGKSMMTVAMLDHLLEQGTKVILVECDTSNPDVWKAYREQVETELINLDEADGWIHLVNTCVSVRLTAPCRTLEIAGRIVPAADAVGRTTTCRRSLGSERSWSRGSGRRRRRGVRWPRVMGAV